MAKTENDSSKHGVYEIINSFNNKRYIGSAAGNGGIKSRWNLHIKMLKENRHHSIALQRAWNKYGATAFEFRVLTYCEAKHCVAQEQAAMDYYQPEYNIAPRAGSQLGYRHTKEGRNKSAANREYKKGPENPWYGRRHKEETIEFFKKDPRRKTWLGKKLPLETRRKISIAKRGCGSVLDETKVIEIKRIIRIGSHSSQQIAEMFGCSRQTIADIKAGRTWGQVKVKTHYQVRD